VQHHRAQRKAVGIGGFERRQIGGGLGRDRAKQELDVGLGEFGASLDKAGPAARRLACRAGAKAIGAGKRQQHPVKPHRRDKRAGLAARVIGQHREVVLQVSADPGKRRADGDAEFRQPVRVADAGQHQQLRRVDHTARQDHPALGARHYGLSTALVFNADRAVAFEHDAASEGPGLDR
jgi:hypothetical protein